VQLEKRAAQEAARAERREAKLTKLVNRQHKFTELKEEEEDVAIKKQKKVSVD
jgi:hypothetical protein